MPEIARLAGEIAGVLSFAAFLPYIIDILRRKTRPNRASWWIWTVVGIMVLASYRSGGAEETIWVPISYTIGPFIIALLAIKYGEGGWTTFDRNCLGGVGGSLILWVIFKAPLVVLCINLFIDFLGALPTIRKSVHEPEGESKLAWALWISGNIFNLFAVEKWTFAIAVHPVFMTFVSGTIAALVLWPRPSSNQPPPKNT
ncbi:hypothetical protein ACFL1U_02175 [Patescibacteria group bacterium]